MKKLLIILITSISLAVLIFIGWYFLLRNSSSPVAETIKNVLPFGTPDNTPAPSPNSSQFVADDSSNEPGRRTSNLFQISKEPVAGAVVFNKNASTTIVRYVDRATGHIYDESLEIFTRTKISNQTLPKIYEAYFRPDGNAVLIRFLKEGSNIVENLSLALTPPQMPSYIYTISSTPLRGNINSVAVGSGNALVYALKDTSSIVSSEFSGAKQKTILKSPFRDWQLAMAGNSLVVYPKVSSSVPGVVYSLSLSGGGLRKVVGPLNGLAALPNATGNRLLYSYVENNQHMLFVKNLTKNTLTKISNVTFAEKCVWSKKKVASLVCSVPSDTLKIGELDLWYKGMTHFSDRIWLFDTDLNIAEILVEPSPTYKIDIDAIDLRLSPNEDYLIFTNKTDLSLWALKMEKPI